MRIAIAGDFAPRLRIKDKISRGDFSFWGEVKELLNDVDYSIVNLESPIIDNSFKPIDKTGPNLFCELESLDSIIYAGFNCVTLANNHFRDYGQNGVSQTISSCRMKGIDYCGGGVDLKSARKILYKEFDGIKMALINVCENEWSIATNKRGGSAPLDPILNSYSIREARKLADYVLVIVHGGVEMFNLPTPRMKKLYRFFIDSGADAVINHHQHCYSGYEVYQDRPIFYGLGNFCFDKRNPPQKWTEGFFVKLGLEREGITFELIPYIQCTPETAIVKIQNNKEKFINEIEKLNRIIGNDELLQSKFDELCEDGFRRFASILYPYQNKYLKALAIRGMLPPLVSRNRLKYLRAFTSCESYHETILNFLNNILSKKE